MSNLLYIVAVFLVIIWFTGYYAYDVGSLIHILLVVAAVAVLLRIIGGKRI